MVCVRIILERCRLYGIAFCRPNVVRLVVHIENEEWVVASTVGMSTVEASRHVADAAKLSKRSHFNQWMATVRKEREADIHYPDSPAATALLYTEMPKYYTWNLHNQREWQRRVQRSDSFETVSRLFPSTSERPRKISLANVTVTSTGHR